MFVGTQKYNIQPKTTRHEKKQKSVRHDEEKNQLIERDPKLTQTMKQQIKNFRVIVTVLHIFRNKDMTNILDRINELDTPEKNDQ